jgi:hypothetical protein
MLLDKVKAKLSDVVFFIALPQKKVNISGEYHVQN